MLFLLLFTSLNSKAITTDSFSFITSFNKEFKLNKPDKYLIGNKFSSRTKEENFQKGWYYAHFLTQNITKVFQLLNIDRRNEIIKNTFTLFLTQKQLSQISNITLLKKINSEDKFIDVNNIIKDTQHFIITAIPHFQLPPNKDFVIEKRLNFDSFIIYINDNNFQNKKLIIEQLSAIPEIKSIVTYKNPSAKNFISSGFTQKNNFNFQSKGENILTLNRYLNEKGLNGEGQIITVLDTPLDYYHSMFRDDKVTFELNKHMPKHRKIVYYGHDGDIESLKLAMGENEHGTHVCGTAAGKSDCESDELGLSIFNGNAPEAKILYAGHFNAVEPSTLEELMTKYKSKISTNSWGSTGYDNSMNYAFGDLAYKNKQSVFLYAAGNDYQTMGGNFSVCDPGGSKNVLTVGSIDDFYVETPRKYLMKSLNVNDFQIMFRDAMPRNDEVFFTGNFSSDKIGMIDMSKGRQCLDIFDNAITFFYGNFTDWVSSCAFLFGAQALHTDDEKKLRELFQIGGLVSFRRVFEIDENKKKIKRAYYSSTGPGNNGLLKPDVMGPGTRIVSAKSTTNSDAPHGCLEENSGDFVMMDGTSMSTPNIAGGVALIHQYFNSNRWIEKVELDGATTRALVINSCKHPTGSKIPDITFGHGVVDLSTILPFDKEFGVQITHQNQNQKQKHSVSENGHVTARLKVNKKLSKNKLQITLSYLDPLLDIESLIPITRDLDIIVTSPSKKVYFGDHLESKDTQHASTNEKIIINENEVEDGEYVIHVYGGAFADSLGSAAGEKQEFSVVASGPIENGYLEFADSDQCPCDKCDPNRAGFCLCEEGKNIGQTCQISIETIEKNTGSFEVGPLEIKRIRFVNKNKIVSIKSESLKPGRGATIWASEKCHLSLGEYEINGETGKKLKSEKMTNISFNSNEICIAIFNNNDRSVEYDIEIIVSEDDENGDNNDDNNEDKNDGDEEDKNENDNENKNENENKKDKNKIILIIVDVIVGIIALTLIVIIAIFCVKNQMCKCRNDKKQEKSLLNSDLL